MDQIPKDAKLIEVSGSTVDFYEVNNSDEISYYFDTSECMPPEPMINAMAGLQILKENNKLIMINHKPPMGLFPRIQKDFNYEIIECKDGIHLVIFSLKKGTTNQTDFSQTSCNG